MATDPTQIGTYLPEEEETRREVEQEVAGEIAGAVAPLQGTITQTERDREAAAKYLEGVFGAAETDSRLSAETMRRDYNQAIGAETAIMGEARERLDTLRQSRAAEAQKLAQQIGGYVPLGEFTDPTDLESSLFSAESAGSLLRATGLAQAGVQHAEAFSGRILPLLRTEELANTRATFDKEITKIRNEIATIKGQKSGMVNERTRQRLLEDREFALERATANRDWELAKKTAQLERDKLSLAKKQAGEDKKMAEKSLSLEERRLKLQAEELYGGEVVWDAKKGRYVPTKGGSPTLQARQITAEQTEARKAAVAERRAYGFELVEAYMNPGVEDVSGTQFVPVAGPDAAGAFWNGNQWVRAITVKQQIGRDPVTDPNQLVDLLIGQGLPRALSEDIVKKRFPKWTPGTQLGDPSKTREEEAGGKPATTSYTQEQLRGMSPSKIINIVRKQYNFQQKVPPGIRDYPPSYKKRKAKDPDAKRTPDESKQYNSRVKDFYIYWLLKLQADRSGNVGPRPNRG